MSSLSTNATLKRLSVDLTEVEHPVLKGHAAKAGLSMRELVSDEPATAGTTTSTQTGEVTLEEPKRASE
jgi:hypothetical protein